MTDFVKLTCPSCGAPLNVTSDMRQCTCEYCGLQHVVELEDLSPERMMAESYRIEMESRRIQNEISYLERKRETAIQLLCSGYLQPLSLIYRMAFRRRMDGRNAKRQLAYLNDQQIETLKAYSGNTELKGMLDAIKPGLIIEKQKKLQKLLDV